MRLATFSGLCDICGKARGGKIKHDACAKKRKAQELPGPTEAERLTVGRSAQRSYVRGRFSLE